MLHLAMKTSFDPLGHGATEQGLGAVICAVLMPHAPVLIPAVGTGREYLAAGTCRAMREAAQKIVASTPDSVVLISPHSPRKSGAFGLWVDEAVKGTFAEFGVPETEVHLPSDRRLTSAIVSEARARNVATWSIRNQPLDHGALVPLWFLVEAGWSGPTVVTSLNYPDEGGLASFGEAIQQAVRTLHRRTAVIASGDMSHRLTRGAPCGFHPEAHRFDETFIQLVGAGDYRGLLDVHPSLRELAAEDALDSTVTAAAAVDWCAAGHRVLNYEGPFGVGYGVAILFAGEPDRLEKAQTVCAGEDLPGIARRSVEAALRGTFDHAPAAAGDYLNAPRGVFVTIRHAHGDLRGCIGTIAPACANLVEETWRNARLAALQDARFSPVTLRELPQLRFEISALHPPEELPAADSLNPERYGVIVSTADGRRGLLLPGIKDINTDTEQLALARRKGRIAPEEPVQIQRFEVDHFEEN